MLSQGRSPQSRSAPAPTTTAHRRTGRTGVFLFPFPVGTGAAGRLLRRTSQSRRLDPDCRLARFPRSAPGGLTLQVVARRPGGFTDRARLLLDSSNKTPSYELKRKRFDSICPVYRYRYLLGRYGLALVATSSQSYVTDSFFSILDR